MKTVKLPDGTKIPALGQGTWQMGVNPARRKAEANALRHGLDLGMTLIDTAEMYDDAELVVGDALQGRRDDAFVVSKVLPSNASRRGTVSACERSLKRLGIDCIDLYLLHWPGPFAVGETLDAFRQLVQQGKIRRYGMSNFDTADMTGALAAEGGDAIATNQVLYNLGERGIEWELLPWCRDRGIPVMAYSPLNQGRLQPEVLEQIGLRHNVSGPQVALAWVLQREGVIAIPKAAKPEHLDRNLAALQVALTYEELKQLDRAFPPPGGPSSLTMI
jgi:diketogulonate reductase-like aldo/keto reductase